MFDRAFIANPYPKYHEWLESGRLCWSSDFFGGAWVLPHYNDNTELLRDSERLTTEKSGSLVAQFPPEYHAELHSLDEYLARWLAFIDPTPPSFPSVHESPFCHSSRTIVVAGKSYRIPKNS